MSYSPGDVETYYFITYSDRSECYSLDQTIIKAWTDDKKLAEFYMEFHNCNDLKLKKHTNTMEEINRILAENYHDQIVLFNIKIKNNKKSKMILIPATETEISFINEESQSFFYTRIDYSYLYSSISFLKNKYKNALSNLFLDSIIKKVIENKSDIYSDSIELDQLMILYKSFPTSFGK